MSKLLIYNNNNKINLDKQIHTPKISRNTITDEKNKEKYFRKNIRFETILTLNLK